jgi:hypothetical protein
MVKRRAARIRWGPLSVESLVLLFRLSRDYLRVLDGGVSISSYRPSNALSSNSSIRLPSGGLRARTSGLDLTAEKA